MTLRALLFAEANLQLGNQSIVVTMPTQCPELEAVLLPQPSPSPIPDAWRPLALKQPARLSGSCRAKRPNRQRIFRPLPRVPRLTAMNPGRSERPGANFAKRRPVLIQQEGPLTDLTENYTAFAPQA